MAGGDGDERRDQAPRQREMVAARSWRERGLMSTSNVPMSDSRAREGQTFAGSSRWVTYVNFVKLPHTVFAMPFALVGVVLASYDAPVKWIDVLWVVIAFTAARFAAMGFNRIVDREFDAQNPRTSMREIPAGSLRLSEA